MRKFLLLALLLAALPARAADNFAVTAGTGTTIATKDLAGVHISKHNLVDQTGAEVGVAAVPWYIRAASGGFASGSIASGAIASGAIAAGAQVDLLTMRGTKNAGTAAANSLLAGGVYNSTPLTLTDTQQASMQFDANGYLKVNTAAGAAAGGTSSAFGAAVPANGTAIGISDGTNMRAALNAATGLNSTGTGILSAQIVGQFDDVAPTACTENQFCNLRMSGNRNIFGTLRDAAGNERGANVNASNELLVAVSSLPSHAVTNAGTFAVQIAANSSVNVAQINGVTTLMGNGATGTGSQRVTLANDNTIPTGWPTSALQTTTNTNLGAPGATTCATDTGSCDLNAKLSRIAERVSTLITNVGAAAGATITSTVTRPANGNTYTVNDVWAATTPAVGGSTLTSACRASGTNGLLTDMIIMTSAAPGTLLQGEIWLFDQAVTAVADEAAFALSDAEQAFLIGVVPFTVVANPSNAHKHVSGINYGYTCVGTANLRYLVKVINAYVGSSAEVLTVKAKVMYVD